MTVEAGLIILIIILAAAVAAALFWRRRQASAPIAPAGEGLETLAVRQPVEPSAPPASPAPAPSAGAPPAADEPEAVLEIESGPDALIHGQPAGRRLVIRQKKVTIGRNPRQVDIQLYDLDEPSSVSRLHCAIEFYAAMGCFMLTDEGSSSGTKVAGMPITPYQPIALKEGDLIELGLPEKQGAALRFHSRFNPPESVELKGARLRVQTGIEAKDTIRQALSSLTGEAAPPVQRDVFLSYSRRDRDVMRYLRESLTVSGISVWSDESLEPGSKNWRAAVEHAIENARCVVAILSPDAKQSEWVGEELNYAKIQRVPIFTVLVRGDESSSVPLGLTGVQWVDMRTDYDTALETILRALREFLRREE